MERLLGVYYGKNKAGLSDHTAEPHAHRAFCQLSRGSPLNTKGQLEITRSWRIVCNMLECNTNKQKNILIELCKDGRKPEKKK